MKKRGESAFRRAGLLLTTTVATLGVTLGLPIKKAWAVSFGPRASTATVRPQQASLKIVEPRSVSPTAVRLLRIAAQALSNHALAERIFRDPDAVAKQYHLSKNERLVLRHMDRTQFQTARSDAAHLVKTRLAEAGTTRLPADATNAQRIAKGMIVGRAILAAVGRSYLEAGNSCSCCQWSSTLELGVNSDPAYYDVVFQKPAPFITVPVAQGPRPGGQLNLPAVQAPHSGVTAPKNEINVLRPGENRLE
jgi:hypothetical protein